MAWPSASSAEKGRRALRRPVLHLRCAGRVHLGRSGGAVLPSPVSGLSPACPSGPLLTPGSSLPSSLTPFSKHTDALLVRGVTFLLCLGVEPSGRDDLLGAVAVVGSRPGGNPILGDPTGITAERRGCRVAPSTEATGCALVGQIEHLSLSVEPSGRGSPSRRCAATIPRGPDADRVGRLMPLGLSVPDTTCVSNSLLSPYRVRGQPAYRSAHR